VAGTGARHTTGKPRYRFLGKASRAQLSPRNDQSHSLIVRLRINEARGWKRHYGISASSLAKPRVGGGAVIAGAHVTFLCARYLRAALCD
jgi:hypothetical protein